MGGFFGVASKSDCMFDLFSGRIIIPIWERDVPDLRFMVKRDLTVPFTILKMHRSVPNLIRTSMRWREIWESDVSQIMSPSR